MNGRILSYIKGSVISIGLLTFLNACQQEDGFEPAGSFSFKGSERPLHRGYVSPWSSLHLAHDTYYEWNVVLLSNGVQYDSKRLTFAGKGDIVILVVAALNNPDIFPNGTYTGNGAPDKNFVVFGGVYAGFNSATGEGTFLQLVKSAKIQMQKTGDNYAMAFDIRLSDGEEVNGSFVGPLTYAPGQ